MKETKEKEPFKNHFNHGEGHKKLKNSKIRQHYLIDGYNLLFKVYHERQDSLEVLRKELLIQLDNFSKTFHVDLAVVFDAMHDQEDLHRGYFKSLEVIYTQMGQSADEQIIEIVEYQKQKPIIVTSDRSLAKQCKIRGAETQSVENFIKKTQKRMHDVVKKQNSQELNLKNRFKDPLFHYYLKIFELKTNKK